MRLAHGERNYEVTRPVAENEAYRAYLCKEIASGVECLLLIASDTSHNGSLDKSAYVLGRLAEAAALNQAAYAKQYPERRLHYERLFPALVDSFVSQEQGLRRINVIRFTDVASPLSMIPLSNLTSKDKVRVDLGSSAWILGRLLKLLVFAHAERFSVGMMTATNILLDPARHLAVLFDWSKAVVFTTSVPRQNRRHDLAEAGQSVLRSVGANLQTGEFPFDTGGAEDYLAFLRELAGAGYDDAPTAHMRLYELIDTIFGSSFSEFKTHPL